MARKKTPIDRDQLIQAIAQVEGGKKPPTNLAMLYKKVSDLLGKSPGAVKGRIEDYGIPLKTQPGRRVGEPTIHPAKSSSTLDLTPFTKRGIVVRELGDLYTSSLRTDEENRKLMAAIVEVRKTYGLPAMSEEEFRRIKKEF
jgi:hypothetical protein